MSRLTDFGTRESLILLSPNQKKALINVVEEIQSFWEWCGMIMFREIAKRTIFPLTLNSFFWPLIIVTRIDRNVS